MTPFEYIFSLSSDLDDIDRQQAKILASDDVPAYALVSAPAGNSLAFLAPADLKRWAYYKLSEDQLAIVSPFGCVQLPLLSMDGTKEVGLIGVGPSGEVSTWKIKADNLWRDVNGKQASALSLKVKDLGDGSFEPLHASMSFRGIDSKLDLWTIVLLPARPERVTSEDGVAIIEVGGLKFKIPKGRASDEVLSGKVQWALPDSEGLFVLQDR